jgi:mono/diheme cytochrome c family protein
VTRRTRIRSLAVLLAALVLGACGGDPDAGQPRVLEGFAPVDIPPPPDLDPGAVERGEALYGRHCATCHGADLGGEAGWKEQNEDGTWKPPPHDDSGHTWHHPDSLLIEIVRDGGGFAGSRMPGFESVLDNDQIDDILAFLKSGWGEEERTFQWQVTWQDDRN